MSEPLVILSAFFGGMQNLGSYHWIRPLDAYPAQSPIFFKFIERLRAFGYSRFFLHCHVAHPNWLTDAEYRAEVERAREFLAASGLAGCVETAEDNPPDVAHTRRRAELYLRHIPYVADDIVLYLRLSDCFVSRDILRKVLDAVPKDRLATALHVGRLPWEVVVAGRYAVEKEVFAEGHVPEYVPVLENHPSSPLPLALRFEPTLAYAAAFEELDRFAPEEWSFELLSRIWNEKPAAFRSFVRHVGMEITNEDNLPDRVRSPVKIFPSRKRGMMSEADWRSVLDDLSPDMVAVSMDFWDGGEPLLHPEALGWIEDAARRGVRVDLRTNGLRLDEASSERLVRSGVDAIFFRMDAATPETYARVNGAALFSEARKNLSLIVAAKKRRGIDATGRMRPALAVELTEMAETRSEAEAFFREYDFRTEAEKTARDKWGQHYSEAQWHAILYEKHDPIEHAIYRHDNLYRGRIVRPDHEVYAPLFRFPCRQLHEGPFVLWDGTLVACREDAAADHPLGHVREGLTRLWKNSPAAEKIFSYHHESRWENDHFCRNCLEWYYPFS